MADVANIEAMTLMVNRCLSMKGPLYCLGRAMSARPSYFGWPGFLSGKEGDLDDIL